MAENQQADQELDDLKERIAWGQKELEEWPDAALDMVLQLPGPCLCATCYLAKKHDDDDSPQDVHYVLVLCPRATGFLQVYRQKDQLRENPAEEADGRLHPDTKYAIDRSALMETVMTLLLKNLSKYRERPEQ